MAFQDGEYDLLEDLLDNWEDIIDKFKVALGGAAVKMVERMFDEDGPPVQDTDPLNPRGVNPQWPPLRLVTIRLKGSDKILANTRQLQNTVRFQIEDSDWDEMEDVIKVGWFEDASPYVTGSRVLDMAHLAAIHEFGLTGAVFITPDGQIMGGPPIGRTPQARARIRAWYMRTFGYRVRGVVIIPERSMLRKAAEFMIPHLDEYLLTFLSSYLGQGIIGD